VVQIIELRRFGGAPNGYPFAVLPMSNFPSRTHTASESVSILKDYI
jgi:hypothetical protein